jgi:hypothetical protein
MSEVKGRGRGRDRRWTVLLLALAWALGGGQFPAATAAEPPPASPPPLQVDSAAPLLLDEPAETEPVPKVDPLHPVANNTKCLVCHANYIEEPFVQWHAKANVGCVRCHGDSADHISDENNLTPPHNMIWRSKVDFSCYWCHPQHRAAARAVIQRWQERVAGQVDPKRVVCTDCHGEHRLKLRTIVWNKRTRALISKVRAPATNGVLRVARPASPAATLFADTNLMAWCIVPFDAKKRGPEDRAAMLERLGFRLFAYDYRAEHIPTFEAEIQALERHHVQLLAWWFPGELNDEARLILDVLKRHQLHVQLWITGGGGSVKDSAEQEARVAAEATRIRPIAEAARQAGCTVALYNHGAWFGEPENQIAIIQRLRQSQVTNVGIVYNLHHGHDHLDRFPALLAQMKPYLLAFNLNGMTPQGDRLGKKILPLAQGNLELTLLRQLLASGWQGPIGILNHTDEDAEARLLDNLEGLRWLLPQLEGQPPGPRPQPRSWHDPAAAVPPKTNS